VAAAGYDAILVGETLVTASDPAAAVAALRGR
jgi:indole-3-glycerol phosphate synthase